MIAQARHMQTAALESAEYSMKGPFTVSLLFHVGFFLFTLISLPFVVKDPIIITPISVELIDPDDLQKIPPKVEDKPKPIEKPKEPTPPKPPPEPEPEPEQVKEPEPEPVPEPKVEKPVEKPKPKPKDKPKPKPKEQPKPDDSMDNLLKDILEREEKPPETQDTADNQKDVREIPDFTAQLSDIEQLNLEEGISPCWFIDGGGKYAENLSVKVRVTLYNDMRVKDVQVLDQIRYATDSAFRAAADSARRALLNPSCSQLNLPAQKYRNKYIDITFDPSKMLGY